ncbi:MAG: polysaccharide biosynthesis/export family protein [Flavobacteriales bacterium]|nr:polysaccharide biosynthesis/export family protein [Flavobacteriales bacterium]
MTHYKRFFRYAYFLIFSFTLFSIFSCTTPKDVVYLQGIDNIDSLKAVTGYESTYQPDDIINIRVASADMQSVAPFNQMGIQESSGGGQQQRIGTQYILDKNGSIEMPIIGEVNLLGKTRTESIVYMQKLLSKYIKDATILISNESNKISILGEVGSPGIIELPNERITIFEAIALAGDLRITGKRDNILLIRDNNGTRSHTRINLLDTSIMDSEYYYLRKNDILYIEPNIKAVRGADDLRTTLPLILGVTSSIISLALILTKL